MVKFADPPGRVNERKWFRFPVSILGSLCDDGKRKWARFPAFRFPDWVDAFQIWGGSQWRFPQARAVWRWSNYLQSLCPCDRTLVLLNIDETSVKLVPQESKGHVSDRAYRLHIRGIPMGRNASLSAQRSCITHMGAVCDHPAV